MKTYGWAFMIVLFIGGVYSIYQIYQMTKLDAKSRGFKHPGLWGLFSISGSNSSGLLLYLIGRRNYPSQMSSEDKAVMDSYKNKVAVGILFEVIGAIGLFASFIL